MFQIIAQVLILDKDNPSKMHSPHRHDFMQKGNPPALLNYESKHICEVVSLSHCVFILGFAQKSRLV